MYVKIVFKRIVRNVSFVRAFAQCIASCVTYVLCVLAHVTLHIFSTSHFTSGCCARLPFFGAVTVAASSLAMAMPLAADKDLTVCLLLLMPCS